MNILLIVAKLAEEQTGGVQTRVINYVKNLPKFNIIPTLLSIGDYQKITSSAYFGATLYKFPKSSKKSILFLPKILKKHKINAVHVLEGALGGFQILTILISRLLGKKTGVSFYGGEIWDIEKIKIKKERLKIKLCLALAHRIIVNSKATASLILKKFQKKVKIVYPGVNSEFLKYLNLFKKQDKTINLLFVGRIYRRKGVDNIIKALALVTKQFPDIRLWIVGKNIKNPIYKDEAKKLGLKNNLPAESIAVYKNLAKKLDVANQVKFLGEIKDIKKLAFYYSTCDIFVMTPNLTQPPSGFESFGCVYLEANLFKKPVIGSAHFGVKEAIIDGQTGLLVPEANPEKLAKAIIKLIKSPFLRKKLGQRGFRRVITQFMDINSTEQLVNAYL